MHTLPAEVEIPAGSTRNETVEVSHAMPCPTAQFITELHSSGTPSERLAVFTFVSRSPPIGLYAIGHIGLPPIGLYAIGYNGLCADATTQDYTDTVTVFEGAPPTHGCSNPPVEGRTFTFKIHNDTGVTLYALTQSNYCMSKTPGGLIAPGTTTETVESYGPGVRCAYTADFITFFKEPHAPPSDFAATLEWTLRSPFEILKTAGYHGFCAVKPFAHSVKFYKAANGRC